jgi:dUTP pyrophosphatase
MQKLVLQFFKINSIAHLPQYAHPGDAGFDLYSVEEGILNPGEKHMFALGIASEIPEGWYVSIRDRSGMAAKNGIHVLGGVVDSSYRGEWKVILVNLGKEAFTVSIGDRIAQGILQPAPQAELVEVKSLSESDRGEGGFGSTGKK